MRRFVWLFILVATALPLAACTSSNNGNGDPDGNGKDGEAGDGGDESQVATLVWSERMEVDLERAGIQLDIEPTADGHFAIAYFKRIDEQQQCTEPILGDTYTESHQDVIRYARFDGTGWTVEDVATISTVMLSGISMTFRGNTPLVAYLGGTPFGGRQVCGGTDLIVADGPGTWNETIAVAVSNEAAAGADCPKMQNICDFGDVVGLWPSIARSRDGSTIGVTYRDVHNGYTKDADDAADLEYAYSTGGGWGHEWIDLARGSGDFSSLAFGNDGEPAVAYYNGEVGTEELESPILFAKRPWAEWTQPVMPCSTGADCPHGQACTGSECVCNQDSQCESPMRCIDNHRCSAVVASTARGLNEKSISLAVGPDGRYLVAYYDPDEQNLMLAHSQDGKSWERGIVDADGNTGLYPSLAFLPHTNKPAIAYYRCNEYRPGETACNRNNDGPRFAYFTGDYPEDLSTQAKWKKGYVSRTGPADPVATDGRHISLAVQPDGTVGVAYYYSWVDPADNSTREHLMFHKGTWE